MRDGEGFGKKEYFEWQETRFRNIIEDLLYLKDEEKLNKYVNQRKIEMKDWIIKVQNSTADELFEHDWHRKQNVYDRENEDIEESYRRYIREEQQVVKKHPRRASKLFDHVVDIDYCVYFTYGQLLELSEDELVAEALKQREADYQKRKQESYDWAVGCKKKYDGVSESEIDEYVELMVQKEVLIARSKLEMSERTLQGIQNNDRQLKKGMYKYGIDSIEDIDESLSNLKERHKTVLKNVATVLGVSGLISTGIITLLCDFDLRVLGIGLVEFSTIVGLISGIYGYNISKIPSRHSKFVEKLKELGIYDLYIEQIKLGAEQEELKASFGNRG